MYIRTILIHQMILNDAHPDTLLLVDKIKKKLQVDDFSGNLPNLSNDKILLILKNFNVSILDIQKAQLDIEMAHLYLVFRQIGKVDTCVNSAGYILKFEHDLTAEIPTVFTEAKRYTPILTLQVKCKGQHIEKKFFEVAKRDVTAVRKSIIVRNNYFSATFYFN